MKWLISLLASQYRPNIAFMLTLNSVLLLGYLPFADIVSILARNITSMKAYTLQILVLLLETFPVKRQYCTIIGFILKKNCNIGTKNISNENIFNNDFIEEVFLANIWTSTEYLGKI